ncbi:DMT family transporter [Azospirillum rugosum]|uniref:S-adenosylmethionine uptake transporter n=1 Tax=Azospirillum rugosum TaxID=416170 RepID=A0ABS4SQ98_9PROT|nr:DMT family transporter [Azospirillum rugosum]MBP2294726.1 S-adenosylmethionine uptake transporter [Azospirillum rugosum]MDQ0527985.1 S-adenosylmethionine uptake transporter [Azospirillum rugosum]
MLKGTLFAFLAFAVFAWGDAVVKAIGHGLDPFEVTFIGYLLPFLLSPVFMRKGDRLDHLFRWKRPWLMALRLLFVAISTPLSVMSFRSLPFAEAFALLFLMPSLVTVMSILVLKEPVRWRRRLAVCAAFVGVLIVARPGFRELLPGHFAAIGCAFASAATVITGRMMGQTERRFTLIGTVFLSTALLSGVLMVPNFTWPTPTQWVLALSFAVTTFAAQALFTLAATYAPAERVGAAQYSQILWALAIGAAFFDEWPDVWSLVGITIVVGSGLFIFAREQAVHHTAETNPAPEPGPVPVPVSGKP